MNGDATLEVLRRAVGGGYLEAVPFFVPKRGMVAYCNEDGIELPENPLFPGVHGPVVLTAVDEEEGEEVAFTTDGDFERVQAAIRAYPEKAKEAAAAHAKHIAELIASGASVVCLSPL